MDLLKVYILIVLHFMAFVFLMYFVSGEYIISMIILALSIMGLNIALRSEKKTEKFKYYKIVSVFLIVCIILRYIAIY